MQQDKTRLDKTKGLSLMTWDSDRSVNTFNNETCKGGIKSTFFCHREKYSRTVCCFHPDLSMCTSVCADFTEQGQNKSCMSYFKIHRSYGWYSSRDDSESSFKLRSSLKNKKALNVLQLMHFSCLLKSRWWLDSEVVPPLFNQLPLSLPSGLLVLAPLLP